MKQQEAVTQEKAANQAKEDANKALDVDRVVQERLSQLLPKTIAPLEAKLSEREKEAQQYKDRFYNSYLDSEVTQAVIAAGGDSTTVEALRPYLQGKLRIEDANGVLEARVLGDDGRVFRLDAKGKGYLPVTEFVKELKQDKFSRLFPGTKQSGGGTSSTGVGVGTSNMDLSELTTQQKIALMREMGHEKYRELVSTRSKKK